MNRVYRLVWNAAQGMLVAVQEGARGKGGKAGTTRAARRKLAPNAVLCGISALFFGSTIHAAPGANELPTVGKVVAGSAAISQNASSMTVVQGSQRAAVDWATFNVGSSATVQFVQPNAGAVILNRVLDSRPSEIFGKINANGQVFLVNPNGVYFAPGASVDVGGLVATTHQIALEDFLAGRYRFERNGSTSSVVNAGELKAAMGGYIAMLAPEVRNEGVVVAHTGTVALAAGEAVTLQIGGSNTLAGLTVTAAQVKSLVENRNLILAPGGLVIMSAQAAKDIQGWVVNSGGRIEATGMAMKAGRIVLDASDRVENSGVLSVDATVHAKAADGSTVAGGPAGSIAVSSGKDIVFAGTATARALDGGKGGEIALTGAASVRLDGATLDASGTNAGGSVRITGGSIEATGGTRILVASDMGQGGQIAVAASQFVHLGALERLDATGALGGGTVTLDAGTAAVLDGATLAAWGGEGKGGTVSVTATQNVQLDGALLDASGTLGGDVLIQAGLSVKLTDAVLDASGRTGGGRIQVRSKAPQPLPQEPLRNWPSTTELLGNTWLRAGGGRGRGGKVLAEGSLLVLDGTTKVDATGDTGGGQILLGGGWQGSDPSIQAAKTVYVGREVVVDASALVQGDGGSVVVWSDAHLAGTSTMVHGTLMAKGGEQGGDGGRIETSGYWLDVAGITANASAQNGKGGEWLLDPYNLTVTAAATTGTPTGGSPWLYASSATETNVQNTDIETQLNFGTSVTLQTSGTNGDGFGNGDITVSVNITKTGGADATLLLEAHGNIVVDTGVQISSTLNRLNVTLNSDIDALAGGGILLDTGSGITTNGGNVLMGGGAAAAGYAIGAAGTSNSGVHVLGSISAGAGNVTMRGQSSLGSGITFGGGTLTSDGAVAIDGVSRFTDNGNFNAGVLFTGSGIRLSTATGSVSVTGSHSVNDSGAGNNTQGLLINGPTLETTGSGTLSFSGTQTRGGGFGWGLGVMSGLIRSTALAGGSITLSGNQTTGDAGLVLRGDLGAVDVTSNGGSINLIGVAGSPGVFIGDSTSQSHVNAGMGGNVAITSNALSLSSIGDIAGTGALTVNPYTAGTSVGIAGAAGTLALSAANFSTNFVDGFASITIGDATTGDITANGFTFADNLTLWAGNANSNVTLAGTIANAGAGASSGSLNVLAAGNIVSAAAITTQNQTVTLNSNSDTTAGGAIRFDAGASVTTNGGNIVMGGGADPTVGYAQGDNTTFRGIHFVGAGTSLNSGGGNISLRGRSDTGSTVTDYDGIFLQNTTIDSGAGTIFMEGISQGTGASNSQGLIILSTATLTSASAAPNAITLIGSAIGVGNVSQNIGVNIGATVQATGGGGITITGTGGATTNTALADGVFLDGDILANSGAITITGTAGTAASFDINGLGSYVGQKAATAVTASSSAITLNADTLSLQAGDRLQSSGALMIAQRTAATTIGIGGGTGTLQVTAANFSTNFVNGFSAGGITVGSLAGTGAITVGTLTVNDGLVIRSDSAPITIGSLTTSAGLMLLSNTGLISLTGPLTSTGPWVTFASGGGATETGVGTLTANALEINGFGTGSFSLSAATNAVGTIAADAVGSLSFVNSGALAVGAVGGAFGVTATGTVSITTSSGDIAVSQNISTADTTATAVVLNAGQATAAGTATGGNITVGGASISAGAGGRATLFTGSVAGSTGLTALVGSGSGNFRYNSDETATNYSTALANGVFAIYREQPTVTVTANNDSKNYNAIAYTGNAGVIYAGFANGDTSVALTGALASGGTSQGALNIGGYTITPSGLSSGLGYALAFVDGTLTVNTAPLTLTANNASKVYGVTQTYVGTEFTPTGLVGGETVGSVTLSSAGDVNTATVLGGPYAIGASAATGGTFTASNYAITYASGSLSVTTAPLTLTANNASKVYGATQTYVGTEFTPTGLVGGDTVGSVTLSSAGDVNTATVVGGPYAIGASAATGGTFTASNYTITYAAGSLSVTTAPLTLTANNASKVYGVTQTYVGTEFTPTGLVGGETVGSVTLSSAGDVNTATVVGGPYAIGASAATGGTFTASNYAITYAAGSLSVTAAPLTVTANSTSKVYDGVAYFGNTGVAYVGFVNGETSAVLGGALSIAGGSQGAVNPGVYSFVPTGLTATNYALSFIDGSLTISSAQPAPPVATITPTIIAPSPGSTGSTPPPLTVIPEPTVEPTLPPPAGFVEQPLVPIVFGAIPATGATTGVDTVTTATGSPTASTTDTPATPTDAPTASSQVTTVTRPVAPPKTSVVASRPIVVSSATTPTPRPTPTPTDAEGKPSNEPITTVGTVQPAVTLDVVPLPSEVVAETIVTTGTGGSVASEVVVSVMRTVSQTENPAQALDALTGSRVATAISSGMGQEQAVQAGAKHSETVANLLAKGVPLAEAMTRAEQVFVAEASFPQPNSPVESVVKNAATGGDNVGVKLTSLAQATTQAGSDAFDKALSVNLAKGVPFGAAVTAAQVAVKQADAMAAADTTPQVKLARGDAGGEKRSDAFDKTMGTLLAKGFTPEQAIQRAQLAESTQAAAAVADAKPSNALAMGNVQALPKGNSGAKFDKAMEVAMLKGVPLEDAIQRAKAADEFERQVNEAEKRNPASGISTGKLAAEQENPIFDRVLSLALARGEPPEKAMLLAKMAAERASDGPQTIRTALASGVKVEQLLLSQGGSRIYRMVLGNALAKGVSPDDAIAMAKRAERANAFRWVLPQIAALKLQSAGALKVTLEGGAALPSWLVFSAANSEFYAVDVPEGGMPLKVVVSAGSAKITVVVKERKDNAAVSGKGS